ncbi:hypothetical protein IT575_01385 [bacterium]|nr:hypothetical protein [bacterium]
MFSDAENAAAREWSSALSPSGDALFDAYAQALVDKYGREGFAFSVALPCFWLDDEVLRAWEARFGRDPRFWELRIFNARVIEAVQDEEQSAIDAEGAAGDLGAELELRRQLRLDCLGDFPTPEQLTQDAFERGALNSELLSRAFLDGLAGLSAQAYADAKAIAAESGVDDAALQARLDERRRRFIGDCDKLLIAVRSRDPQAPWPHYMQALELFERGDMDRAWQAVDAGNMIEGRAWPGAGYPLSFVAAELADDRVPGNPAVCAALDCNRVQTQIWFSKAPRRISAISALAQQSGDINKQAALIRMLGRIARDSSGSDRMTWLASFSAVLDDQLAVSGARLSAEQLELLASQKAAAARDFERISISEYTLDAWRLFDDFRGPWRHEADLTARLPALQQFWQAYSERQILLARITRKQQMKFAAGLDLLATDEPGGADGLQEREMPGWHFELAELREIIASDMELERRRSAGEPLVQFEESEGAEAE